MPLLRRVRVAMPMMVKKINVAAEVGSGIAVSLASKYDLMAGSIVKPSSLSRWFIANRSEL